MLKVTLQYTGDCGLDTRNVFANLAASNVYILKTTCESYSIKSKIIILIEDYDKLNKLVFDLNKNTNYGVSVLKVKKTMLYICMNMILIILKML